MNPLPSLRPLLALATALIMTGSSGQAITYRTWRHFNSNNGLTQNSVVQMELDTAGYVWIGTEGGLVRYDGGALLTVELHGHGAVTAKRIRRIIPTIRGEIIVEDANGNGYDIHGHIAPIMIHSARQNFEMTGGLPSVDIYDRLSRPRRPFTVEPQRRRVCLTTGMEGMVVLSQDSLWTWHDTLIVNAKPLSIFMDRLFVIGQTLFGTDERGGVHTIDGSTGLAEPIPVIGLDMAVGQAWPRVFWHQGHQTAFMVVDERLFQLHYDAQARSIRAEMLSAVIPQGHTISDILAIPGTRTVLVGTSTTGLHVLRAEIMHATPCKGHVITRSSVFAQAISGDRIYFTAGRQVYRISPEGCSPVEQLSNVDNFTLPKDHEGRFWAWRGSEVFRYDPSTEAVEVVMDDVHRGLAIKPQGDSVIICQEGAIRVWRAGRLKELARVAVNGYQDWPSVFAVGPAGGLSYGCDRGLFIGSADHKHFTSVKGVEDMDVRTITRIEDLQFIGTYGHGWYLVRGDTAIRMPNDPLNCLDYTHSFHLREGVLWISTNRGLIRTTMADLRTYLKDPRERPYLARFGSAAGMVNLEFNGGCDPAFLVLEDGSISYPTIEGPVRVQPASIPDPFPQLSLIHGQVRVDGRQWGVNEYLVIDPDVAEIEFDFSLPYWGDPENAQFEYSIPGLVDDWRLLSVGERTVRISRPPPGEYEVYIRKVGSAARGIAVPTVYWFRIRRPFWATWPALVIYGLGLTALLWLGTKLNTVRLRRRNKWLEENVAMQTEALLHANKELRNAVSHQEKLISVISHDVVPPLRFVARVAHSAEVLLREGRPGNDLAETLSDLSASTNKLHSNAESLLTWIRTRSNRSGPDLRTVAVREITQGALHRVKEMLDRAGITAVDEVSPASRVRTDADLVSIVVHNALMNVYAHAHASRVTVSEEVGLDEHIVIIADNGTGIPPAVIARLEGELHGVSQLDDTERRGPATGLGFVIIAECMRQLGGRITLVSDVEGTQVRIHLPVEPSTGRSRS
ncbi:MAG: ATP-binding protein [Flavobacteriales bacterium]